MPALDFREIATPTSGPGRDSFELFARDVLDHVGYVILEGPDRGADGGRDLIVEELRAGVGGKSYVRWLVSCKHKAHSGSSVSLGDESDIQDRLNAHNCAAFLCFYSTVPSSGLAAKLIGASDKFQFQVFDPERIERLLLSSPDGLRLAKRYFPLSIVKWQQSNRIPAKLFDDPVELKCDCCGRNLLTEDYKGIVTLWHPYLEDGSIDSSKTEYIYFSCKGLCDGRLRGSLEDRRLIDGWEDISDLQIPTIYLRWLIGVVNQLHGGHRYSQQAFDKAKDLLIGIFPTICKHLTEHDSERISALLELPEYLGGIGGEQ